MSIRIPDLLDGILEATALEASAKARIAAIRAALEDEARRRHAAEGAAPSWKAAGAGTVRFDPPGDWTPTVADPRAFGSFVAEHYPTEATAVLRLPAADLEAALAALAFAGIGHAEEPRVEVRDAWQTAYLKGLTVDVEETDHDEAGNVLERTFTLVDDEGLLVEGLTGTRSAGKLVVSLDRDRRVAAIDTARAEAEELVAVATGADQAGPDPDALRARRVELEGLHADQLAAIAKARDLGSSGTKAALAERIARHEAATGHVIAPASSVAPTIHRATVDALEVENVAAVDVIGDLVDRLVAESPLAHAIERLEDGRSREVLRQAAKARGISAAGTKRDVARRLAEAGVTPDHLEETLR